MCVVSMWWKRPPNLCACGAITPRPRSITYTWYTLLLVSYKGSPAFRLLLTPPPTSPLPGLIPHAMYRTHGTRVKYMPCLELATDSPASQGGPFSLAVVNGGPLAWPLGVQAPPPAGTLVTPAAGYPRGHGCRQLHPWVASAGADGAAAALPQLYRYYHYFHCICLYVCLVVRGCHPGVLEFGRGCAWHPLLGRCRGNWG